MDLEFCAVSNSPIFLSKQRNVHNKISNTINTKVSALGKTNIVTSTMNP